jgi:hypothetical protein
MSRPPLISLKFDGFEFLEAALIELGDDREVKKALKDALVEAAQPMAKAMRALAIPEVAETIDVSTTLSRRQRRAAGRQSSGIDNIAFVYVGPKPRGLAVLEEFGTVRRHWKTGKSTGSTRARPFARPGFEQEKEGTVERFGKILWITIEKAANRIAKRQAKKAAGK